jgi:hypothetical protein
MNVIHNANDLIKYIYDNSFIQIVLDENGCHSIREYDKEFRCGLPNETSKNRVSIKKNEYINITIYQSESEKIRGNIFTLIMHIHDCNFSKCIKLICGQLGLKYKYNNKNIKKNESPVDIFVKIKKKYRQSCNVKDIELYNDEILGEYTPNLTRGWIREGILSFTARKFNIGYDYQRKRIVIPERYWCGKEDEFMGIMGRTVVENYDMFDIPKYLAIKPYSKSLNLYGLYENYRDIQEKGCVVVHESQKSVLKRHSRLDKVGVSVGCHDLSDEQIKILIGLNVDIIIAFDKGINQNHIRSICDKFYGKRNISYMWDKYDILKDKEAPADREEKVYNYLFNNRIHYDKKEREEYFKWLEKTN